MNLMKQQRNEEGECAGDENKYLNKMLITDFLKKDHGTNFFVANRNGIEEKMFQ